MNQNCSKRCAWFRSLGMIGRLASRWCLSPDVRRKPKPMAQPSSEQVKGSADRAFDRLKQEEGRRPSGM